MDCGKKLEEIYKGRQGRPSEKHGQNDRDLSQKGETRDLVAQDLGLGNGKTWERLKEKVTTVMGDSIELANLKLWLGFADCFHHTRQREDFVQFRERTQLLPDVSELILFLGQ